MSPSPVYLCGPINGCTDAEATDWRTIVKALIGESNCLDPMRRDYRGREDESVDEIVELDKADIQQCNAVLANCWQMSVGTSMEIMYAFSKHKRILAIVPPGAKVSPWLRYHAEIYHSIPHAIEALLWQHVSRP